MKKEVFLVFAIAFLLAGMPFLSSQAKVGDEVNESLENRSEVRVAVKIENKSSSGFFTQSVSTSSIKEEVKKKVQDERHDFGDTITIDISKKELKELKKTSGVEKISKVEKKELFLIDSRDVINSSDAWNSDGYSGTNLTGKGESVCVLDTGADTDHPALKGQNATCVIDCTGSSCVENCSVSDYDGHGSHMAGIITGNGSAEAKAKTGVARGAKYIPVKVCTQGSGCYNDDIKAGLDWCRNNMSKYNISVASMSLGSDTLYKGYCDDASDGDNTPASDGSVNLTGSINKATKNNLSVIVSSGNDASTTKISNPACVKNSVSVADTYDKDLSYGLNWSGTCIDTSSEIDKDNIVCHANRNNVTDLLAPGALINSSWKNGKYKQKGGTSMAAPHVAAAFAIINQYKRLESSTTLNTSTIQDSLNDTGKRITDSGGSGLDFSRINIFSSLLDLDAEAPNITSKSPSNSSVKPSKNLTVKCNVTDGLQLKNSTVKIWNSTSLRNESSKNTSDNTLNTSISLKGLENGEYKWNCINYDESGNKKTLGGNYTFNIGNLSMDLKSPSNDTYTKTNSTNFSCKSETSSEYELKNTTFKLWNSSGLEYNETTNISGTSNTTDYNYTLRNETSYKWNCKAKNNNSDVKSASSNYTITYDITNPNVTLISPSDGESKSGGSQTVNFDYNVSEENLDSCSLLVDNKTEKTNSSINSSIINTFSKSLSAGSYSWKISCTDLAGNSINSSSRSLTIKSSSNNNGGGSGGGGSGGSSTTTTNNESSNNESSSEGETQKISKEEISKGVSKGLGKGDKVEFEVDFSSHSMKVNEVSSNEAEITIRSETINLSLKVNESEKVNFEGDGDFDLFVKLNSIENEKANFTLKEINESIGSKELHEGGNQSGSDVSNSESPQEIDEKGFFESKPFYIMAGVLALFIVATVIYFKSRKGGEYRKVLDSLKNQNS